MSAAVVDRNVKGSAVPAPETRDEPTFASKPCALADIQDMFQRAIIDGNSEILASILDNGRTTADVLLGVYQHAYRARLIEILGSDYPCLKAHMGADDFDKMADAYITAHPSDTANVRWFGRHLSSFLSTAPEYALNKDYADLAALECALANAFDAGDDPVLSLKDLGSVPPDDWAHLIFEQHPSVTSVSSPYDIYALWQALQSERAAPEMKRLDAEQYILCWRKEETARARVMGEEEAMMWFEARRGAPFGRLCELIATFDDPDGAALRAAQYLQGWVQAELLSGFRVSPR